MAKRRPLDPELRQRALLSGLPVAAWRTLRAGGWRLLLVHVLAQVAVLLIALPVIRWLFAEALRNTGMHGVDLAELRWQSGSSISLGLLGLVFTIALWAASLQLTLLVIAVRRVRVGESLAPRPLLAELGRVLRKLAKPSSLGLLWYVFLVLPLAQFGFFSVLTHTIAVPSFISGELVKTLPGLIGYVVFLLIAAEINVRLALTLPLFALSGATGGQSMRLSARLTGRIGLGLQGAFVAVLLCAFLLGMLLSVVALLPTVVADDLARDAAPAVAAFSLGAAQVLGTLIAGFAVVAFAAILVELLHRSRAQVPEPLALVPLAWSAAGPSPADARRRRRGALGTVAVLAAAAVGLGAANVPLMSQLDAAPETLVLAHRGFSLGGVENTLSGLDAALAAGADLVEMDVMQTKDGEFVAMHDAKLDRLAGRPGAVGELTLAELTALTVRDQYGHSDTIPSFADYVRHAERIGMPLLIEIKPHGGETPDVVPRLIAELESLGALDHHLYHSLDKPKIEELKRLRPGLTVGYTMAFAGVRAPSTTADFIVVEEWSYGDALLKDARRAGLGLFVWTVNEPGVQRQLLRDGVDGIITDRPDTAVAAREGMWEQSGFAETLGDAISRFVVIP